MNITFTIFADTPEEFRDTLVNELVRRITVHKGYDPLVKTKMQQAKKDGRVNELETLLSFLSELQIRPSVEQTHKEPVS